MKTLGFSWVTFGHIGPRPDHVRHCPTPEAPSWLNMYLLSSLSQVVPSKAKTRTLAGRPTTRTQNQLRLRYTWLKTVDHVQV